MSKKNQPISKIADLPREVRERISQMLVEGRALEEIAARIAEDSATGHSDGTDPSDPLHQSAWSDQSDPSDLSASSPARNPPAPKLTDEDIVAWQKTGHQDWLEERKRLAELEHIRDLARAVLKSGDGAVIQEASLQIVAARLYELLDWFSPKAFKKKTHQNLADYARLVNALIKLSDSGLKYERYRAQVAEHKAEMEKALQKENDTPGLSEEAREIIERELKLL